MSESFPPQMLLCWLFSGVSFFFPFFEVSHSAHRLRRTHSARCPTFSKLFSPCLTVFGSGTPPSAHAEWFIAQIPSSATCWKLITSQSIPGSPSFKHSAGVNRKICCLTSEDFLPQGHFLQFVPLCCALVHWRDFIQPCIVCITKCSVIFAK